MIFSIELAATIYTSRKRSALVFDLLAIIDVCALLPWYITAGWMARHHLAPFNYDNEISAGFAADASIGAHFTTWFLLLHAFKVLRVFKVGRHLPGSHGRAPSTPIRPHGRRACCPEQLEAPPPFPPAKLHSLQDGLSSSKQCRYVGAP